MKESEEVKQYQLSDDSEYDAIDVDNKFTPVVVYLNNFNHNLIFFASKEFNEFLNSKAIVSEWDEIEQKIKTPASISSRKYSSMLLKRRLNQWMKMSSAC